MRLIFYVYLLVMVICYTVAIFFIPETTIARDNLVGILNIVFLLSCTWWLARVHLYIFWALYLVILALYYSVIHPALPFLQKVVIYGSALLLLCITAYDVLIRHCQGIVARAAKRFSKTVSSKD